MMIESIDDRQVDICTLESFGGVKSAKAAADNDHARLVRLRHGLCRGRREILIGPFGNWTLQVMLLLSRTTRDKGARSLETATQPMPD